MTTTVGREIVSVGIKAVAVIATVVGLVVIFGWLYETELAISDGVCNVAVLPIEGTILPFYGLIEAPLVVTPEHVDTFLSAAEEEVGIEAVIIEINSPGGTPVASERIAERIHSSSLPIVGLVGDVAASGGYMIAAASDHLIASAMSDVGSIGVDMSYVEESLKNEEEGLTYVQLTTGKFKDAGSPNRPITDEERALFQRDLDVVHDEFVALVASYRSKPVSEIDALADGSSMIGERALEAGLVDSIGGWAEAKGVVASLIGKSPEDIVFCEYKEQFLPI